MLHKEFFGFIFLGFVFWIIIATTPSQRIENACRPLGWGGSVITSVSALVLPNQQVTVQGWFDKVEYGCRYTVWRLFYQDAYNQWKATHPDNGTANSQSSPPAAPVQQNAASEPVPQLAPTSVAPAPVKPASAPGSPEPAGK